MLARTKVLIHDHFTVKKVFLSIPVIRFVGVFVQRILFATKLKRFYTLKKPGCPPTTRAQNERVRPSFGVFWALLTHIVSYVGLVA